MNKNQDSSSDNKRSENIHEGHRDRLRERFLKDGIDSFEDHNVLELLLFYGIPFKDTNEIAHRLMEKFGSFSNVFDATYEDLCTVQGMGSKSALLLKLIPELFKRYEIDKIDKNIDEMNSASKVAHYASKYFKGLTFEKLYAMYLDSNCNMLGFECVGEGNKNLTPVNNRTIVELGYEKNATSIILVHNHPSGIPAPSKKDVDVTIKIADTLENVGMRLDDHIIIGHGDEFFSFRMSKKWRGIFK